MKNEKPIICPDCGARHYYYTLSRVENGMDCHRCSYMFLGFESRVYIGINDGWLDDLIAKTEKIKINSKIDAKQTTDNEVKKTVLDKIISWLLHIRRKQDIKKS